VQVLLGGIELLVAQQLLDAPQVLAILQQMGGEGMSERVTGRVLRESGVVRSLPDRALDRCPRAVVPFGLPVLRVGGALRGGKHVVPGPRGGGAL